MAYPISSIPCTDRIRARAFTLVEVMVSVTLGSFIFAGVISTFLMIGRTGANAANYCDLDLAAHQGLETFGREVHNANGVTAFNSTSVTITLPDTTSSTATLYSVTYAYDSVNHIFTRTGPPLSNPGGASTTTTLISGVQTFALKYFSYQAGNGYINGVPNDNSIPTDGTGSVTAIEQIELTLTAQLSSSTVVTATNTVLSACFTLRNKN